MSSPRRHTVFSVGVSSLTRVPRSVSDTAHGYHYGTDRRTPYSALRTKRPSFDIQCEVRLVSTFNLKMGKPQARRPEESSSGSSLHLLAFPRNSSRYVLVRGRPRPQWKLYLIRSRRRSPCKIRGPRTRMAYPSCHLATRTSRGTHAKRAYPK